MASLKMYRGPCMILIKRLNAYYVSLLLDMALRPLFQHLELEMSCNGSRPTHRALKARKRSTNDLEG